MEQPVNKHKNIQIILGLVILICVISSVIYLNKSEKPFEKIQNIKGYDKNTAIEVYKSLPEEFPEKLIIKNTILNHSDIVRKENGDFIVTAVFSSEENILKVMSLEQDILKKEKWVETFSKIDSTTGFIQAVNDKNDILNITFSINSSDNITNINFQLEHKI